MSDWSRYLAPSAVVILGSVSAQAAVYLTVEQAQRVCFKEADNFVASPLAIDEGSRRAIAKAAGVAVRGAVLQRFEARVGVRRLGWLYIDRVLGKHETIGFALALDPQGKVLQVEVLDYRESYGGEIRRAEWRQQLVGKGPEDPLRLDQDVRNIAGATLSCRHLLDGVRRVLITHRQLGAS